MRLKAEFRLLGSMTLDKVDSKDLACNRKLVNELAGQSNERLRLDASINNNRKRGEERQVNSSMSFVGTQRNCKFRQRFTCRKHVAL